MTPNRSGQHFTSTQRKANFDHERLYGERLDAGF